MEVRQNPIWLSLNLGTFFQTEIRLSVWFFLVVILLCASLGLKLGLIVTAILFVSLIMHEFGHIFAARRTGGSGDSILIWPLGGLATVSPAQNFYSEFWTISGGPAVNLIICVLCSPAVFAGEHFFAVANLLSLPAVDLDNKMPQALLLLTASINLKLLAFNLLPIYPLDGGQMSYLVAKLKWEPHIARLGSLWVGMLCCLVLLLVSGLAKSTELAIVASVLMIICSYEHLLNQIHQQSDELFQPETFRPSGNRQMDEEFDAIREPGFLERWKMEREQKKREKEVQVRIETDRRVDGLLEKVHLTGINSLTEEEKTFLQKASGRYRSKNS